LNHKQCERLESLADIVLPTTRACQAAITDFLDLVITKYGISFAQSKVKHDLKVLGRMIQWHLFEIDKIVCLRNQLRRGLDVILLMQSQAQGYVSNSLAVSLFTTPDPVSLQKNRATAKSELGLCET
jgi:hypothetical protein